MHTIYIYSDSVHFNNNSYAMQSSVPTRSCLADSNLNMCLQKWFQRKMWNYDKINNSRSWIVCISITLIKCETVNLFLFSLNTLPNKKMHCCLTGKNDTFKYWLIMSYFVQMVQTAIQASTLTFVRLSGTSENWRRTSRSCITVVRRDKWKNQIPKRAGTTDKSISIGIKYWVCCIKEPCLISNLSIIYFD